MADIFVWNEKYGVRVNLLDEHHKKLFALMSLLHNALLEKRGKEVISQVLDELFAYTKYHFSEEEKLMMKSGCNGISAHKDAHKSFVNTLTGFKEKLDSGFGAFISTSVLVTLNDWLINHIGRMDKLYGQSMNDAGIS